MFSVQQSDIIIYGFDLADYLGIEFGVPRPSWLRSSPRPMAFWSGLAAANVIFISK